MERATSWSAAVVRLALLTTCVGFAASRLGLVVHEFVGHGGATLAVGGEVQEVHLFAFAGGWIRYRLASGEGALVIALGGIGVELAIGGALWLALARRPQTLTTRMLRALGCALVVHAAWYLGTGTWHGYGDGVRLHRELGDARWVVAVPAGVLACTAAFAGARVVFGAFAATIPAPRIVGTVIALVVAGGIQLGAAVTEVRLRRDATYAQTMRHEPDRVVARDLAAWERAHRDADAAARARKQAELVARAAVFPYLQVLAVALGIAVIAGAWRSRRGVDAHHALPTPLLVRAAIAAGTSIAVVIAIDQLFH